MTREALSAAYQRTTGRRINRNGSKERQAAIEIIGVTPVVISQWELKRYNSHGLANIKIPMDNFAQVTFIIDTEPLTKISTILEAWLKQSPETLTLHLSGGLNISKENALDIRSDMKLEGILINTTALGRTTNSSQYKAEAIPLYGKQLI